MAPQSTDPLPHPPSHLPPHPPAQPRVRGRESASPPVRELLIRASARPERQYCADSERTQTTQESSMWASAASEAPQRAREHPETSERDQSARDIGDARCTVSEHAQRGYSSRECSTAISRAQRESERPADVQAQIGRARGQCASSERRQTARVCVLGERATTLPPCFARFP